MRGGALSPWIFVGELKANPFVVDNELIASGPGKLSFDCYIASAADKVQLKAGRQPVET